MEIEITKEKSSAISVLRVLATISIVLCHYQQAFHDKWAWVFNIGVQVFFVLSGYLYGHKEITNWGGYFLKRLIKLYIPLYVLSTIALLAIEYLSETPVGLFNYLKAGGVDGLNHLWFMKAIAICYIITPILQFFRKYVAATFVFLCVIGAVEYIYLQRNLFTFSWLFLYAMGYYYPQLSVTFRRVAWTILSLIVIVLTLNISWTEILNYDGVYNRCWHDLMGMLICISFIPLIGLFNISKMPVVIKWMDKNSFYLYLTHHIYLVGPLSFVLFIPNASLCVAVTLLLILLSSVLLAIVSELIINRLFVYIK